MTTLIGRRCTHSNVFSRPVLIGRGLGTITLVLAMEVSGGRPLITALTMSAGTDLKISGGHSGGVTPVPIPNTEVKPASADGTWGETPWESRSPPDFSRKSPRSGGSFACWVRSRQAAPTAPIVVATAPSIVGAPAARGRGTEELGRRRSSRGRQRSGRRTAAEGLEGVARRRRPERRGATGLGAGAVGGGEA